MCCTFGRPVYLPDSFLHEMLGKALPDTPQPGPANAPYTRTTHRMFRDHRNDRRVPRHHQCAGGGHHLQGRHDLGRVRARRVRSAWRRRRRSNEVGKGRSSGGQASREGGGGTEGYGERRGSGQLHRWYDRDRGPRRMLASRWNRRCVEHGTGSTAGDWGDPLAARFDSGRRAVERGRCPGRGKQWREGGQRSGRGARPVQGWHVLALGEPPRGMRSSRWRQAVDAQLTVERYHAD